MSLFCFQTLFLASALIKFIWTRGGASTETGLIGLAASAAGIALHKCASSSENSVSLDPSNSEEEHVSNFHFSMVSSLYRLLCRVKVQDSQKVTNPRAKI